VEALRGSADAPDALFAVACGLALKAAGRATIDVNLTPAEVHDLRATRRRASRLTAIGTCAGIVVVACVAAVWLLLGAKASRLAELKRQVKNFGGTTATIAMSENEAKRFEDVGGAIENVLREEARPLDIAADLSHELPSGVWVTELSYDAEKGVAVRGTALDGPSVADSVRALLRTKRFGDVVLDYQNLAQVGDRPVYNFQITCKFPAEEEAE
jgi:Tfp pilus assembly protein PilN